MASDFFESVCTVNGKRYYYYYCHTYTFGMAVERAGGWKLSKRAPYTHIIRVPLHIAFAAFPLFRCDYITRRLRCIHTQIHRHASTHAWHVRYITYGKPSEGSGNNHCITFYPTRLGKFWQYFHCLRDNSCPRVSVYVRPTGRPAITQTNAFPLIILFICWIRKRMRVIDAIFAYWSVRNSVYWGAIAWLEA